MLVEALKFGTMGSCPRKPPSRLAGREGNLVDPSELWLEVGREPGRELARELILP